MSFCFNERKFIKVVNFLGRRKAGSAFLFLEKLGKRLGLRVGTEERGDVR